MTRICTGAFVLLLLAAGCGDSEPSAPAADPIPAIEAEPEAAEGPNREAVLARAQPIFGVLALEAQSDSNPVTDAKIELGRALYFDPRLSRSQEISCNSCHDLASFGVDAEPTSPGHGGQRGDRNSPTVYNAAFHVAQFWDGRAADVEEQAKGPILNPVEMAMGSEEDVVAVLQSIPGYEPLFRAAFPDEEDQPSSGASSPRAASTPSCAERPERFGTRRWKGSWSSWTRAASPATWARRSEAIASRSWAQ
jgi:cytochrome c peroxidase